MDACTNISGLACRRDDGDCPGHSDPGVCRLTKALADWGSKSQDEQAQAMAAAQVQPDDPTQPTNTGAPMVMMAAAVRTLPAVLDPKVLAAIHSCPDRGSPLSASDLVVCGCQGRELYHCRAGVVGETRVAGRVTSRDCYWCREAALAGQSEPLTPTDESQEALPCE